MIYGQYAKEYTNKDNKFSIVSESDAIINYLFREQNQYKNLLLNESFFDEQERLVMEAKYEVLQEAVAGVLIAAVISVLTVLGALLVKFLSMLNTGSTKVKDNANKMADNVKKNGEKAASGSDNSSNKTQGNSSHSPHNTRTNTGNNKKNDKDTKGIISEYRKRIRKLSEEVSARIKSGKIDTQADWFKIIRSKVEEDFKPSNISDKFKGFYPFDYSKVVNAGGIKRFNDDIRIAATDRDTSNINQKLVNNTGSNLGVVGYNGSAKADKSIELYNSLIENGYMLLDKSIWNDNILDAGATLVNHYNQNSDDSIEYAAMNTNAFIKSNIKDNAEVIIKKMNDDIDTLKNTLDRLKKVTFNASDIAGSKVNTDGITDPDELDRAYQRQIDNNRYGEENKQEFISNMMYIEKHAIDIFSSFTRTWAELEQYRYRYANDFNKVLDTHVSKGVIKQAYKEIKMKYGDSFTEKEPYPEYN